jgi:hypothetical protein
VASLGEAATASVRRFSCFIALVFFAASLPLLCRFFATSLPLLLPLMLEVAAFTLWCR